MGIEKKEQGTLLNFFLLLGKLIWDLNLIKMIYHKKYSSAGSKFIQISYKSSNNVSLNSYHLGSLRCVTQNSSLIEVLSSFHLLYGFVALSHKGILLIYEQYSNNKAMTSTQVALCCLRLIK